MTNQSTIDKLIEMLLTTMADAFRNQLDDPKFKEIPFEDRFGMLVDIEYSNRKNNRQKRLIRNAGFDQPEASIMDINYTSGRKLNKDLINRLVTCEYISEHRNLFITGATGCGKTYMACAFGMEACKQYFNTKYVRLPDLLIDLEMARTDGNYKKVMAKYANPVVLILDEWLLLKPTDSEQRDIFELLHRRRKKSSTIFCSQYEFEEWYDQLGGDASPLADAIIDRIAHDSYRINITSIDAEHDRSMREVYGLAKKSTRIIHNLCGSVRLDRWLTPHWTGGSAAQEYSQMLPVLKKFIWRWDLRISGVGLMVLQTSSGFSFNWILMIKIRCFSFVGENAIGSRHYFGKETGFSLCTKDSTMVHSDGHALRTRQWPSQKNSTTC